MNPGWICLYSNLSYGLELKTCTLGTTTVDPCDCVISKTANVICQLLILVVSGHEYIETEYRLFNLTPYRYNHTSAVPIRKSVLNFWKDYASTK